MRWTPPLSGDMFVPRHRCYRAVLIPWASKLSFNRAHTRLLVSLFILGWVIFTVSRCLFPSLPLFYPINILCFKTCCCQLLTNLFLQASSESPLLLHEGWKPNDLYFPLFPEIFYTSKKELHKFFPYLTSTLIPELSWFQLQTPKWRAMPVSCLWSHVYLHVCWTHLFNI